MWRLRLRRGLSLFWDQKLTGRSDINWNLGEKTVCFQRQLNFNVRMGGELYGGFLGENVIWRVGTASVSGEVSGWGWGGQGFGVKWRGLGCDAQ